MTCCTSWQVLERLRKEYAAAAAALAQAEGEAEVQGSTLGKLRQEIAAGASANDTTRCPFLLRLVRER